MESRMTGKAGRYDTSALREAQFEPGSRGRVLRNLLGITRKREMDRIETEAQFHALEELVHVYGPSHRFTARDIRRMHAAWLGDIYPWAGEYRQVQLIKADFPFAAAYRIPDLMAELEARPLRAHTPCHKMADDELATALAVVHVELILIHPFRDGNGRIARMLAILMGLQAGLPALDFSGIKGRKRQAYFVAVRKGLERDYRPMTLVFEEIIERTRGISAGNVMR